MKPLTELVIKLIFLGLIIWRIECFARDYASSYFTAKAIELCADGKSFEVSNVPFGLIWRCQK